MKMLLGKYAWKTPPSGKKFCMTRSFHPTANTLTIAEEPDRLNVLKFQTFYSMPVLAKNFAFYAVVS